MPYSVCTQSVSLQTTFPFHKIFINPSPAIHTHIYTVIFLNNSVPFVQYVVTFLYVYIIFMFVMTDSP